MTTSLEIRSGRYHDSVRLMQASRALLEVSGIQDALVAMATDLNLELLAGMGFDLESACGAGPDDLLVAIRAADPADVEVAHRCLDEVLSLRPEAPARWALGPSARTIESATRRIEANVALVSVPGPHAFVEAMAALRAGLHVMVFSDNVPIEQEVTLKREAARRNLLVMGPDCGTTIVSGVGLGFANVVLPGPIGITGASGTGIQQLCCLLDAADVGVRHALGTGSRDLSVEVGAASTMSALAALDAEPSVEVILVVSKPPAPTVAARVREAAAACATPVVMALLGESGSTLEEAAAEATRLLERTAPSPLSWPTPIGRKPRPGVLRGLFSGGTLMDEAAVIAAADPDVPEHRLVDLGADEYTQGRPHPMIDYRLRLEQLHEAADDPTTAVILLDVVLGHGAHPDPASELAPAIRETADRGAAVVVSLCGTRHDPQDRDSQASMLQRAGASVWLSNAAAARHAVALAKGHES